MKTITAKFNSKCSNSGLSIKKGEVISYDPYTKKAYKKGYEPKEDVDPAAGAIQANEDAFFDNFCINNNI